MYDNDTAGQQAILRLTEMCWLVNLELKVISLPLHEDPASFLHKGGAIQQLLHAAQDIFLFFISSLGEKFIGKPLNQKLHIMRSFLSIIKNLTDPLKQDILLQKAAKTFDIPFDSLKQELSKLDSHDPQSAIPVSKQQGDPKQPDESLPILEKRIFCAIMSDIQLLQGEFRQRLIKYLPSPLKEIVLQLKNAHQQNNSLTFSRFFDMLDEHNKKYVSKLLLENNALNDQNEFDTLLIQLQKRQWKVIVHDIKIQLARAKQEGDKEKESLILHDFMQLQNTILQANQSVGNGIKKAMGE